MRKYAPALVLGALVASSVLVAQAADTPVTYKACVNKPSPDDTDVAKALFKAGSVSYSEGDYPKAIEHWREAFDRDCTAAVLLQNLANAYEKAGKLDAAILSLETFLKRDPQNAEAGPIGKRIENMKKTKAAQAATEAPKPTVTAPASNSAPPPPPTTTAPAGGGDRPLTPLFVAGGGGVLTIVGGVLYLTGASKVSDAEKACPDRTKCTDSTAVDNGNSGRSREKLGGILAGVGLAGVAGGLIWYFVSPKSEAPKAATRYLVPEVGQGYSGLLFGGKF
jgi:tetratricopeptide (TPR) repeat protein